MKRILHVSVAVLLLLMAVLTFAACGSDPDYDIYNVSYDPVNKLLTWSDNSPAESWLVSINGESNDKVKNNQYEYDAKDQTFSVRIEGLYKDKGHDLNPVTYVTVTYLPPVQNLRVENGYLVWDHVPGATGYRVNNNGYSSYAGECSYQIPAGAFNITVYPETNGCFYTYPSESVSGVIMAAPQNLRYENGAFVWDAVANADYYEVVINGTTYETTQPSYAYERNKTDIHIAVSAGSRQEGAYKSSPLERTCYYLKPIAATNYSFNAEGALTWPAVENATHYVVTINGQNTETVSEPKYSNIAMDTRYTVKVVPMADFSYTDEAVEYTFEKLSPVTGVKFAEGKITWDAHPRAVSYEVKVNGQTYDATGTSYDMSGVKETLNIEVYAKGDIENARSYTATKEVYTYLPVVTDITVRDGVLVWSASEGAVRYDLQFQDGTVSSETPSYANIQPNRQYIVKIIPRGADKSYSYWSGEFTFMVLAAPTVTYNQGTFLWQGVNDASGYVFKIEKPDGKVEEKSLTKDKYSYAYDFAVAGQYKVSVKMVADPVNANVYDSAFSSPITVTKLANVNSHELINTNASTEVVQVSVNAIEGANGYKVFVNGVENQTSNSNTFSLDLLSLSNADKETTFTIEVLAVGSVSADRIVLDSSDKYSFTLVRLATPQNVTISGNTVSWNTVNNAAKYLVSVDGQTVEVGSTNYTFTNLQAGKHTVRVQAINRDSKNYVPSRWTTPVDVTKLVAPPNVHIEAAGANDVIVKWDGVEGAKGYTIKVGDSTYDVAAMAYVISDRVSTLEQGTGLQISVYAIGNGGTIINSEPSKTITIARLATPSNIAVSGDNITWNPSVVDGINAESYILTINGEEYPVTGTSFSVDGLPAGEYNVTVRAIGNKVSTIDSPNSAYIKVTKLAAVTDVAKTMGGKTLTWNPIAGATSYSVNVNGEEYIVDTPSYTTNFTTQGDYKITIRALSGAPNVLASDAYVINQKVEAMQLPKLATDASNLQAYEFYATREGDDIVVTVGAIEGLPVKYDIIIDNLSNELPEGQYSLRKPMQVIVVGYEYKVKVQFLVSCFGADGVYYINSMPSAEVTIDGAPQA